MYDQAKAAVLTALNDDTTWHEAHPNGGYVVHADKVATVAIDAAFGVLFAEIAGRDQRINELEAEFTAVPAYDQVADDVVTDMIRAGATMYVRQDDPRAR